MKNRTKKNERNMNVSFIIYCDVISLTLDIDFFSHQILLFFLIMMVVVGMLFGMDKKKH